MRITALRVLCQFGACPSLFEALGLVEQARIVATTPPTSLLPRRTTGMTMDTSPQRGRPVVTAREAGRVLRRDPRTIRRMIESGELAGGADSSGQRRQWFVYTDQISSPVAVGAALALPADHVDLRAENARLQLEVAALRARLTSTEDAYRLVLASQSTMREALSDYQESVDAMLAGTNGFRDAATQFHAAATGLQASNSKLTAIIDTYSDALHQTLIPGDAGSLDAQSPAG